MRKIIVWGLVLIAIIIGFYSIIQCTALRSFFSLHFIQQQRFIVTAWTQNNYCLAVIFYITMYFFAAALALPAVSLLTITGGFLFGPTQATLYTIIGATSGAVISFLASRYLFGSLIRNYYQQQLQTLHNHLTRYGIFYLIWARLIPVFPFFLANILAGLMPISLRVFIITTALGIIPVTFLYASAGQQLMTITSAHEIFSGRTMLILSLLALLATLPLLLKKIRLHDTT